MQGTELRIGIVGAGPWGRNLLRAFQGTPGAKVAAICDSNPSCLQDLDASAGGSVSLMCSADRLIGSRAVQALVVATPPETHATLALDALRAGLHVFVEKPMALSSADAALLCQRAREASRKLMVGHILLYHPAVEDLLARIRAGDLGEIKEVRSRRFSRSQRSGSETAWWSLAPHDVSVMRELFASDPLAISASSQPGHYGAPCVQATLSFGRDRTGVIEVGMQHPDDVRLMLVVGTRGSALFDDRSPRAKLTLFDTLREHAPGVDPFDRSGESVRAVAISRDEPLAAETKAFVDWVVHGRPTRSDAAQGYAVTSVLEIGAASIAAHGALIDVTPPAPSMNLEYFGHGARPLPLLALT